ncbi:MAG: hypothetical protein ACI4T4_01275 [Limosilactobacillus sp.]
MLRGCKLPVAAPTSDQVELALMLALCWVLAGAYNQLLIYRYVPGLDSGANRGVAIINALTMICMIVLAWGKPAVVLFPRQFSSLVGLLGFLSLILAGLGSYFISRVWPAPDRLPLWLGPGTLAILAVAVPLFFNGNNRWGWLLALVMVGGIHLAGFQQLPRLLATVAARRSALYNLLVGAELAALFSGFLLGTVSCYQRFMQGVLSRLSICWGSAGVFLGIGAMVLAACQRYHNDFRYGHAANRENCFVAAGALSWVGILVGLILAL